MIQTFTLFESQSLYGRSTVIDPIPGPETIGPSLDGPDMGVYLHEVGATICSIKLQGSRTQRSEIL
jgi:hypothetical protein